MQKPCRYWVRCCEIAMGFILFVGEVGRCSIALEAAPIAERRGANIPRPVVSQFERDKENSPK